MSALYFIVSILLSGTRPIFSQLSQRREKVSLNIIDVLPNTKYKLQPAILLLLHCYVYSDKAEKSVIFQLTKYESTQGLHTRLMIQIHGSWHVHYSLLTIHLHLLSHSQASLSCDIITTYRSLS